MPVASYRSTLGVAKVNASTTLASAAAASATSLTVATNAIPASSTIFLIDGPNTEQKAISAGGGTTTLTVTALANAHAANIYIPSQLTASVGPADYIPVTVLEPEDTIAQLQDKGLRGSAVDVYGAVQGTRFGTLNVGGDVIIDTFPYFVASVTGSTDFTGGTPNQHAFAIKNTSDTQPTDYLFWDFNAIDTRMYAGAKVSELAIKYDPAGLLTYTAKISSWMSGPVTATTSSYSALTPAPSWQCQATIGGTAVNYVMTADVTIKRPVENIFTAQGIQDPYKIFSGVFTCEGTMNIVMEDNTQLNNFLNASQPSVDIKWTASGANPNFLQLHMSKCNYSAGKPKQTGTRGFVELAISFFGLATTSDATTSGTGSSPVKVTCGNSKATGTYL